jgi:Flp pilus assembly pilin Flp
MERRVRGQASVEYVALVALVGLVLAAAVALTAGGLGEHVAWAWRAALCRVTGGPCPAPFALRADLPPCPLADDRREQRASVTLAVVHADRRHGLRVVRYSDRHVEVSTGIGAGAGLTVGVGGHFNLGGVRVADEATAEVGWTVDAGRTWSFPDRAAADRFLDRYGRRQEPLSRALRAVCLVCGWFGARPAALPPPTSVTHDAGTEVQLTGQLGAGLEIGGAAELNHQVLGSRTDRDGSRALYLRGSDAVRLSATAGVVLGAEGARDSAIELDQDAHGRVTAIALHGLRRHDVGISNAGGLLHRTRAGGRVSETETTLSDPSPAAVRGALLLVRAHLPAAGDRGALAALAAELRRRAIERRRTYALHVTHGNAGVALKLGLEAGADVAAGSEQLRERSETARAPGLPALPRGDCRAAAR